MQAYQGLRIFAVPLFQDNYSYILQSPNNNSLALIDPASPSVVLSCLEKYFASQPVRHIFYTHKHWDHAGGAIQLSKKLIELNHDDNLKIYAGNEDSSQIGTINCKINQDGQIQLKQQGLIVKTLKVPCHTRGHTMFRFLVKGNQQGSKHISKVQQMVTNQGKKIYQFFSNDCIFTGDTLFSAGVGRFFEGNAEQMYKNLVKINKQIPNSCHIFNGHQYTLQNIKWGAFAQPDNAQIKQELNYLLSLEQEICTLPTSIEKQRKINVFLRAASQPENKFKLPGVQYLHLLRQAKNSGSDNLEQFAAKL